MTIGLESSPMCWPGMFASSWAFTAGSVMPVNWTLCGPPDVMTYLIASPDLMVMLAGSNLSPVASPTIFTSWVAPVGAAGATAPAAGVVVLGVAVAVAGVAVLVAAALAAAVSVADLVSPPQAPRAAAPA